MQSSPIGNTIRFGNHALTAAEQAAGVSPREPFVGDDGLPADPDTVTETIILATGEVRTFGYPDAGPTDLGVLTQESTGRFYVDLTPVDGEDGLVEWRLKAAMELGVGRADKGAHFIQRDGP